MKRIIVYLTAILLLFAACDKGCKIKHKKNVKPIDLYSYNDVYTIYWNYSTVSSEKNKKIEQDRGKDIMIYGWESFPHGWSIGFGLTEFPNGTGTVCTIGI